PDGQVVSVLHLCHAAKIGVVTVGRKGQPSRLRLDHDELAEYIEGRNQVSERVFGEHSQLDASRASGFGPASTQRLRVYISATTGLPIMASIQDALQIADIESVVVERDSNDTWLLPHRTFQALRRCNVGVIIVSRADCRDDGAETDVIKQ